MENRENFRDESALYNIIDKKNLITISFIFLLIIIIVFCSNLNSK